MPSKNNKKALRDGKLISVESNQEHIRFAAALI